MGTPTRKTRYIAGPGPHHATWQTFGVNHAERFVYDPREFDTRDEAVAYAEGAQRFFEEDVIEEITKD